MVKAVKIQAQENNKRLKVEAQTTAGQQTQQKIRNTYTGCKNPVRGKYTGEDREVSQIITTPRRSGT